MKVPAVEIVMVVAVAVVLYVAVVYANELSVKYAVVCPSSSYTEVEPLVPPLTTVNPKLVYCFAALPTEEGKERIGTKGITEPALNLAKKPADTTKIKKTKRTRNKGRQKRTTGAPGPRRSVLLSCSFGWTAELLS